MPALKQIRYLILVLTTRCNLKCCYCYHGDLPAGDMPPATMQKALGFVDGDRPFHLQLTGGEPTLVPHLVKETIAAARNQPLCQRIGLQTNGTGLTPDLAKFLAQNKVQIGISLDGPPAVQQKLRGGAARTLRCLQMLEAAGIEFRITTVVSQANINALAPLLLTLAGFAFCRGIGLDLLVEKGRTRDSSGILPVKKEDLQEHLIALVRTLDLVNQRRKLPIELRERERLRRNRRGDAVFCHACRGESLAVAPDGRLYPCAQTLYDPYFAAGTVNAPEFSKLVRLSTPKPDTGCHQVCPLRPDCPGDCPSRQHYNQQPFVNSPACVMYRTLDRNRRV